MKNPIYINDSGVISPLSTAGFGSVKSAISSIGSELMASINEVQESQINALKNESKSYRQLDRSVLLAILASRELHYTSGRTGINVGSSRGATGVWEESYDRFRESGIATTQSSPPLTTLGNISTWIAQDLGIDAVAFSHSITCATASHAVLNAIAWLESDMVDQFIVGGAEAPLTPFTIAQMKALRIYATQESDYPCKAMNLLKNENSMVLGEAAACFLLAKKPTQNTLAKISSYGTAIEKLNSATSVSTDGTCLQESMKMALANVDLEEVDAIITHSPGTIKGDMAEFAAIKEVFGANYPALCNNKWQLGHSLGASSALSIAMALEMFDKSTLFTIPYLEPTFTNPRGKEVNPKKILINATGFGGNAVSLLLEKHT
ncbi:3-oxoacyl-[acyl-carrier-protein] synthase [Nonlabens ulvanivorans]|nr:beta-ketoacyl synthase N-terminal-like domain-containing protein [Nonlabens ulvanivorans]GAK91460.1 3-oxoacyl-[acyl-carrier-protein] synthase [Nonlabens ulvanivorans]GAK92258.1 3-oxoacyl-[acyl-carrier-protein] synthase [Nonlabens ulvanivorans]